MCGVIKKVFGGLFGGSAPKPAPVVYQTPVADNSAAEAAAAATAAQDKTKRRRAIRSSSLLATGGEGDLSSPVTGAPAATAGAKQALGG